MGTSRYVGVGGEGKYVSIYLARRERRYIGERLDMGMYLVTFYVSAVGEVPGGEENLRIWDAAEAIG